MNGYDADVGNDGEDAPFEPWVRWVDDMSTWVLVGVWLLVHVWIILCGATLWGLRLSWEETVARMYERLEGHARDAMYGTLDPATMERLEEKSVAEGERRAVRRSRAVPML